MESGMVISCLMEKMIESSVGKKGIPFLLESFMVVHDLSVINLLILRQARAVDPSVQRARCLAHG